MIEKAKDYTLRARKGVFRRIMTPFIEITRRYHTPDIKTTKTVRVALLLLRIYLILLIGILVIKFITMVKK